MKKAKKKATQSEWLIFIDTNVFLDFYRLGEASAKRTLETLKQHDVVLITTDQVWMEFLKNRQKVILDTIKNLTKPTEQALPSAVSYFKAAKAFSSNQSKSIELYKKVIIVIEKILKNPARYDAVYRDLNKLFRRNSELNLKRPDKKRYEIRRLARKRFSLGYPPRKDDTLRFGDAINWEWIISCANADVKKRNVIIVSRDGDYGLTRGQDTFINDWLQMEFKERVSRKRKLELTSRLSVALKKIDVQVAAKDVAEEDRVADETLPELVARPTRIRIPASQFESGEWQRRFQEAFSKLMIENSAAKSKA
ncbi:hypothetical protein ASD45_04960 [Pseudolabrys sp. Root1462]|uniref:PIN domain-containing protein n=1 Tax=Pseudolabrys sp. Root1462 TaxID=1736466 RepID=UPI0007033909|nr:PIN domain-containing protein [Pseudolabrys sp. Root1462]KQZ00281.1 hypothetical protein ASD45_04960 [Pseudolabrys sp. Root1462]